MPHANSIDDGAIFELKPLDLPIDKAKLAVGDDSSICWDFTGLSDAGAPAV